MSNNKFYAQSQEGRFKMEDYTAKLFAKDLRENNGARYIVERITPESRLQRNFFEGAVVKLFCYFHETLNWRDWRDCQTAREWLALEFNGEMVTYKGKTHKIAKSTKGILNKGFVDRCIDMLEEQNGINRMEVLNPAAYKTWRDTIFPDGGPDNYIDYLIEMNKLPRK